MLLMNASSTSPSSISCTIRNKPTNTTITGHGNILTYGEDEDSNNSTEAVSSEVSFLKARIPQDPKDDPLLYVRKDDNHPHPYSSVAASTRCLQEVPPSPLVSQNQPPRCEPVYQSDRKLGYQDDTTCTQQEEDVPDLIPEVEDQVEKTKSSTPSQATTIPASHAKQQSTPLTSCLKKKSSPSSHAGRNLSTPPTSESSSSSTPSSSLLLQFRPRPPTQRRVRGLWKEENENKFQRLRADTLIDIFSYLNLADLCRAGMVGRRWKYHVQTSETLWKRIDATEFVQQTHATFCKKNGSSSTAAAAAASHHAGQALERVLRDRHPESLVIRNIQDRLQADSYLPSINHSLQELTLTNFDDLTDTHVHVMMVMTLNRQQQTNQLQSLLLEDCPRLTNASIRSIVLKCTNLKSLSLKGNTQMDDLTPLADLLVTKSKPKLSIRALKSPPPSLGSFQNFFMPPPPPQQQEEAPSTPPRDTSPPPPSSSLQSLFAPPGMSPPRTTNTRPAAQSKSSSSSSSSMLPSIPSMVGGDLQRLDLRNTNVSAHALLQCLKKATANKDCLISLQSLQMNTEKDTPWKDAHLVELAELLAWNELEELHLSCCSSSTTTTTSSSSCSKVTNKGLRALTMAATPRFSKLKSLHLGGHASISGMGVASIVSNAPQLQELTLHNCHGVALDTKGMEKLLKSLTKNHHRTIQGWSLRGCFAATSFSSCNNNAKELATWQSIQDALSISISTSTSSSVLPPPDVRDSWCHQSVEWQSISTVLL